MRERPVLSLCIPTFNRKKVLLPDVSRYLSLPDGRFEVFISDNSSDDGTVESLSGMEDGRLTLHVNDSNLGPIKNAMTALSLAHGEYVFFLIDKDTLDERLLPLFIDYLIDEKPCLGFVDLNAKAQQDNEVIQPGVEAVLKTGFSGKHPSGYFWRKDLFMKEFVRPIVQSAIAETDFPFDLIVGALAAEFPVSIVHMPLVINANLRPALPGYDRSFSYQGESKFYCSAVKRLSTYRHYLATAMQLDLPVSGKERVDCRLLQNVLGQVTVSLRQLLKSPSVCAHYMLSPRKVSLGEMLSNISKSLKVRKEVIRSHPGVRIVRPDIGVVLFKSIAGVFLQIIREPFSRDLELGV